MRSSDPDLTQTELVEELGRLRARLAETEGRLARYQAALLEMAKNEEEDLAARVGAVTRLTAKTLEVERVGFWRFEDEGRSLVCFDGYILSRDLHERGAALEAKAYPDYFRAIAENRNVAAADARTDPRTSELGPGYLEPLGIRSILDVPVRSGGRLIGVLCHEHVGSSREWTLDEQNFSSAVADFLAQDVAWRLQRQTEAALRESEAKLQAIFRAAPTGIGLVADRLLLQINDRICEMTGYTPEELIGKNARVLYPTDADYEYVGREKYRQIAKAGTGTVETRWRKKDGEVIDVLLSSTPLDQRDLAKGVTFTALDITERKRTEEERRRLALAVRYSSELVNLATMDGRMFFLNPAGRRMLGIEPGEVERINVMDVIPAAWRKLATAELLPALEQGRTWEGDLQYQDLKTGELTDVHALCFTVPDLATGKPLFLANVSMDVTAQARAAEETRRLRNLLKNMIDSMPSVMIGTDRAGRVTHWNREAERATGIEGGLAQGRPLAEVYPYFAAEMENLEAAILERRVHKEVKVPHHLGGEIGYSDVTIYPLLENGADGAVIRIDDVTQRTRIEEMMIQTEKMLSVGGLAAGMAHEINNPLAGILQNAQVIKHRLSPELPKNLEAARAAGTSFESISAYVQARQIPSMLEAILASGKRAAEIVDNMLSFSRKSDSKFSPCDLAGLLEKTLELAASDYDLKKKYDFKKIRVRRHYDPDAPPVPCEPIKIQQVILNLLRNGAQAMAEKTYPEGDGPCFELRVAAEGERVRVEIADNGPGMEEAVRKRVFEPFYTTKGVGVGAGLGLSVSYFIIAENHGGELWVESVPGAGSVFRFRLPRERKPA